MQLLPTRLVYFLEVARTGSLAGAAGALTVAPPAISRQIAKLEAEIGVPLFVRHRRGMTLTDAGTRLLAHLRRSEAESTTFIDDLRAGGGLRTRTITVACSATLGRRLLPCAIATFQRDDSDVVFQLDIVGNEEATRRVIDGAADVAVTYATRPQQGVHVEGAAVVPVYAIVPAGHELAKRDHIGLVELCEYPLALHTTGITRELFEVGIQLENVTCRPMLICDELAPLYEFVRHCGGVALIGAIALAGGVGDPHHDGTDEGVAHVKVDHAVFRRREAQVQTMAGRMLPPPTMRFAMLLVSLLAPPQHRIRQAGLMATDVG